MDAMQIPLFDTLPDPDGGAKGYERRDRSVHPTGCRAAVPTFPFPLIPRSEWAGIIKQQEQDKSGIMDILLGARVPPKNQQSTNFCWGNGPVGCLEDLRAFANEPYVDLSPASVCCKINGFRNQGGMGLDAVEYIAQYGVASTSTWPANAISRQYDGAAADATRVGHKFAKWYDLHTGDSQAFDRAATCILGRYGPVTVGYDYWSHEVHIVGIWTDGSQYGAIIRNSWGSWGDGKGFARLDPRKSVPDDAQVCCLGSASPV